MSYKLIIVDDERIIREGLRDIVDWPSCGFEIVRLFSDGREAIEYIGQMPVDVILTDIKMTFVSGMDVARYVHENKPGIKVVLISGYKEFELALEAIKYGVKDYILKPTDMDNLEKVMTRVKRELEAEREESDRVAMDKSRFEESLPILREQFFIDLLMGAFSDEEYMKRRFQLLYPGLNLEQCVCFTANLTVEGYENYLSNIWKYGKSDLFTALNNFLASWEQDIHYQMIYKVHDSIRIFGIFFENTSPAGPYPDAIAGSLEALVSELKTQFSMDVRFKIVSIYNNILEAARNSNPVVPKNAGSNLPDMVGKEEMNRIREKQKLFLSNITAGNIPGAENLFHSLLMELHNFDVRTVKNFVVDMFSGMGEKLGEAGIEAGSGFNYSGMLSMKDIDEIEDWGKRTIQSIAEYVAGSERNQETGIISRARSYIRDNCNRDLSLEEVAGYFYLSPFYFSRIFKQQTGENFIDYLVKVKMEKAAALLEETGYKAYEISEMIGYKSVRYFSRLFRLNTGYTPSEYRNRIWNRTEEDESEASRD